MSAARSRTLRRSTRRQASCSSARRSPRRRAWSTASRTASLRRARRSASSRLFLHGTTVAINTILERTGARCALHHHAGLPRHLRDRPGQPAGILQSVLQTARAADRPRPALRNSRAHGCARQGADPARRGRGARSYRAGGRAGRAGDRHPVPALLPQSRRTSSASRRSSPRCIPSCSSPRRTSCRRSTASSSAPRRRPPTPMWGRACGAISARWASISTPPASAANS